MLEVFKRFSKAISVCDKGMQLYASMAVGTAKSLGGRRSILPVLRATRLWKYNKILAVKVCRGLGTLYKASTD